MASAVLALLALVTMSVACTSTGTTGSGPPGSATSGTASGTTPGTTPRAATTIRPLHATRGTANPGIFDDMDRQVLLRGVNLNSLGDYYQGSATDASTIPFTDADADLMAAQGFNVVRLIVSWSLVEPTKGHIDQDYIRKVRGVVDTLAARGIYSVIDMHQDAWGKYIASPADVTCPVGEFPAFEPLSPSIGWDGAPEWATITDGQSTCHAPLGREYAPAVATAFENFYTNRDGIQDEFVKSWAALAGAMADSPAVAGYDLLNEPSPGLVLDMRSPTALATLDIPLGGQRLGALYGRTIDAIRGAEAGATNGFNHIVFFEPGLGSPILGMNPPADFTSDTNIVFAPHFYGGSIGPGGSPTQDFAAGAKGAAIYGTTFWVGEYGWWGNPIEQSSLVFEFGKQQDEYRVGGTWWQWKQACGDPHAIGRPGGKVGTSSQQYLLVICPGDKNAKVTDGWARILTRAWPWASPGALTSLTSRPGGDFEMKGTGEGDALLWVPRSPGSGDDPPTVSGVGMKDVKPQPVEGGWHITVTVSGDYTIGIAGPT